MSTERASNSQKSHFRNRMSSLWRLAGSLAYISAARATRKHTEMQRLLTNPTPFYAALGCSNMPALYWDLNQHEYLSIMISAYQPLCSLDHTTASCSRCVMQLRLVWPSALTLGRWLCPSTSQGRQSPSGLLPDNFLADLAKGLPR